MAAVVDMATWALIGSDGKFRVGLMAEDIERFIHKEIRKGTSNLCISQYMDYRLTGFDLGTRDMLNILKYGNVVEFEILQARTEISFDIGYSFRGTNAYTVFGYISLDRKLYVEDIR